MSRVLALYTFLLISITMCDSLGIFELNISSSEPQRLFICIGPDCLLGRRYLYLDSDKESVAKFNITGGEWQKNFTIDFQLTIKSEENREETYTKSWRGAVKSGQDYQEVLFTPIRVVLRYTCAENIFGPQCKTFCKPSSGLTGHFSCGPDGERMCLPGFIGIHCNKPDCPSGCGNGTCISPGVCRCQFGFKGNSCQECMPNRDCLHGTCSDNIPGTCQCLLGWTGQNCNLSIDYCTTFNPCKNGGNCVNGKSGSRLEYVCECPNGFVGRHCEGNSTEHICGNNVCLNGGKCSLDAMNTRCDCPEGFSGSICEINKNHLCRTDSCKNGGTCLVRGQVAQCACPTCFTGSRCELAVCAANTTVTLESSHENMKTAETLVIGFCLGIAIIGMLSLGYCLLWRKLKRLILVNTVIGERTNQDNSVSNSAIDHAAQYKICPRSSFEAPPPYSSTVNEDFKPEVFKYTTLAVKQTRISKYPRFSDDDGAIV